MKIEVIEEERDGKEKLLNDFEFFLRSKMKEFNLQWFHDDKISEYTMGKIRGICECVEAVIGLSSDMKKNADGFIDNISFYKLVDDKNKLMLRVNV